MTDMYVGMLVAYLILLTVVVVFLMLEASSFYAEIVELRARSIVHDKMIDELLTNSIAREDAHEN